MNDDPKTNTGDPAEGGVSLSEKIADPFWTAENPLYVVGVTGEKRSHYVHAGKAWATSPALCGAVSCPPLTPGGPVPQNAGWNARSSMQNVCGSCHAEACRFPCIVKKVPDAYLNSKPWYLSGDRGRRQ